VVILKDHGMASENTESFPLKFGDASGENFKVILVEIVVSKLEMTRLGLYCLGDNG